MKHDDIVVVIVEPRGGINVGLIARLLANFGFKELRFVKPHLSEEEFRLAKKFAMRGAHFIERATSFDSLAEAVEGVDLKIATSARGSYTTLSVTRRAIGCEELTDLLRKFDGSVAIVLGREDKGLTRQEIELCDLLVTVDTGTDYRTLNITHAAAIIFYAATRKSRDRSSAHCAPRSLLDALQSYFSAVAEVVERREFRRKRAALAFRRVIARALPTEKEASLIVGILRKAYEALKELNNVRHE